MTIYRGANQTARFHSDSMIALTTGKMKLLYQKANSLSSILGIAVNIGALVSPKFKLMKIIKDYKSGVFTMFHAFTITIALCNLIGIKDEKKRKVLVMMTLFMLFGNIVGLTIK